MIKRLLILLLIGCFCNILVAQDINYRERVYVYTDKNCYLSGEDIWIKFVVYDNEYKISDISKTGYIEIADTDKPYIQLPLVLEAGVGSINVKLPRHIPGGVYCLSGYTRFMRNEGEESFFTKEIVIVNPERSENSELLNIRVEDTGKLNQPASGEDLMKFGKRSLASIRLPEIPHNLIDYHVSITREDITTGSSYRNELKAFRNRPISYMRWMPEYEGHIVSGRFNSDDRSLISNISLVGNTFCFFSGKPFENRDLVEFYTYSVYGDQEIVITLNNLYHDIPAQAKPEILSPFAGSTPEMLNPAEVIMEEQSFMERYMATQVNTSHEKQRSYIDPNIYSHNHFTSYNLDEYNQFPTLEETIFEFVHHVKVSTINKKKRLQVFMIDEGTFNNGNTLVLLDGIPIFDHEQALAYNPRFVQYLNVYNGNYVFGGRIFRAIVSLITYENTLPHFILNDLSGLVEYTFPLLPETFVMPDYSDINQRESQLPDFRTTLYWQPHTTGNQPEEISFYTSDLTGKYNLTIEGITTSGNIYKKTLPFYVGD